MTTKTGCVKCHDKTYPKQPPCKFALPPDSKIYTPEELKDFIKCKIDNTHRLGNKDRECSNYKRV